MFAGTAATFQQSLSGEPVLIAAALLAVLALMVWHTEFSIIALIGVILLIGIDLGAGRSSLRGGDRRRRYGHVVRFWGARTLLGDQQSALNIEQNRLVAAVTLIQALGGGWDTSQL